MKKCSRTLWKTFFVILFAVSLTACGGGGGGGGDGPTPIPLKTNTIRSVEQGDYWNYTFSGTLNDGVTTVDISGTGSSEILFSTKQSPITSDNCLDGYTVINFNTPSGPLVFSVHNYFLQDLNGSIYEYGEDTPSGDIWVTSPAWGYYLELQSPIAVGQNYGTSVTFDDGTSSTYSYSVIAIENVSTGIGIFESYRILINSTTNYTSGDQVVASDIIWYVPGLGEIKSNGNASYYSGGVFQFSLTATATLNSTNVVY